MSLRPVRQIFETKPTVEGAGVKLQRAFGFGKTAEFDPFLLLDDFRSDNPRTIWPVFRGIPTAESRPSPTFWPVRWRTETALATKAA